MPSSVKSIQEVNWVSTLKKKCFQLYGGQRKREQKETHECFSTNLLQKLSGMFLEIMFSFTWGCWQVYGAMAPNTRESTEFRKMLTEKNDKMNLNSIRRNITSSDGNQGIN